MGKKEPMVTIERSVVIGGSIITKKTFYDAIIVAYLKAGPGSHYTVEDSLSKLLDNYPNLYIDYIDKTYVLYCCNSFDGLFPRIHLGSFEDPTDLKEAIVFMSEKFDDIKREIHYHKDCI